MVSQANEHGTILVVDDSPENLKILRMILIQAGYSVRCVTSGEIALRSVRNQIPDLIILDVGMPEMDGYEVCQRLKANEHTADIPIIFISPDSDIKNKIKAFQSGGVDYITRPFQADEVSARVRTHIQIRKYERELEKRLTISERRLDGIFEQTTDAILLIDASGHLKMVNSKACHNLGYSKEELLNMRISDLDPEFITQAENETLLANLPISFEGQYQKKDGTLFPVEVRMSTLDLLDHPMILGLVSDITERKKKEHELKTALERTRQSQKEIEALLEASQAIPNFKSFDKAARVIFDECKNLIGATSGYVALLSDDGHENEVLFLEAGNLPCTVDPELPMPIRGLREVAYRTKEVAYDNNFAESKWVNYMPRGHVYLENVMFAPLNIQDHTVGLIGIANKPGGFTPRDVEIAKTFGDLAAVALTYARYQDELRESERKYRSMMEALDDATFICSADRDIIFLNPAMIKRVGRDCLGEKCYKAIHNLDDPCPWCDLDVVMEGKSHKKEVVSPLDNRTFYVSSSPIYQADQPVSKLTVFRDITKMRSMEKRLQQAQKMEAIGNLAGGIAHDFNNILSPIVGMSELLMEDLPPNSPEQESAQEILRAGLRGSDLANQILAFSRQTEDTALPVSVQSILTEALKLTRSTIPANIEIAKDIQRDCGMLLADPTQLHQVAMNLITNAYHAVEDSGGKISVQLKDVYISEDDSPNVGLSPGPYAMVSVSDTGCGIEPDIMDKIFEPYFTTKELGKGTGLGLATVYGIVKKFNGDIKVYSEKGKGSVFLIYLPMIERSLDDVVIDIHETYPTGDERILLVDDEKAIALVQTTMLERLGYSVKAFTNSLEALNAFGEKPDAYDLVITDLTMPHMTGDQLSREIQAIKPGIPIIVCTGYSEQIMEMKEEMDGVKAVIMKPAIKSEMARTVRKVLDEGPP